MMTPPSEDEQVRQKDLHPGAPGGREAGHVHLGHWGAGRAVPPIAHPGRSAHRCLRRDRPGKDGRGDALFARQVPPDRATVESEAPALDHTPAGIYYIKDFAPNDAASAWPRLTLYSTSGSYRGVSVGHGALVGRTVEAFPRPVYHLFRAPREGDDGRRRIEGNFVLEKRRLNLLPPTFEIHWGGGFRCDRTARLDNGSRSDPSQSSPAVHTRPKKRVHGYARVRPGPMRRALAFGVTAPGASLRGTSGFSRSARRKGQRDRGPSDPSVPERGRKAERVRCRRPRSRGQRS